MNKVIMYGPELDNKNASYGGGTGGYTRNMKTYIDSFVSDSFTLIPCFHTIQERDKNLKNTKLFRLARDLIRVFNSIKLNEPQVIHILAQYRGAILREFFVILLVKIFGLKVVYEIKAGQFDTWFEKTNLINKMAVRYIIKKSDFVLCEGERYINFLQEKFSRQSIYWPNFVPSSEIVKKNKIISNSSSLVSSFCFIGYCYEGKGVFELIIGLNDFCKKNKDRKLILNLVGEHSPSFSDFLSNTELEDNFNLSSHGKLSHDKVLKVLSANSAFILPSKHVGEGHNNSINEAMMLNIPILSTRQGFLGDILNDRCIFIDDLRDIVSPVELFFNKPNLVRENVKNANEFFQENLHSDVVVPKLIDLYQSVL
ncbi:glycosyltransferase [Vibrio satsumensis]|uniref:glycosyltransferase n=1 Tax=Vibrio satsumensis TaxID=2910245 RepID=UPI003D103B7D